MNLLMITNEYKSHYVYAKDFNIFMCNKTKDKNKIHISKYCLQCFSSENVSQKHKQTFLKINGKQSVKLRSASIKFENYLKQLATPSKIDVDFESLLNGIRGSGKNNNTSYTERYQKYIPFSLAYKVRYIDDKFSKPFFLYRGKNAVNKFIESILKQYDCCKKLIKKNFKKN